MKNLVTIAICSSLFASLIYSCKPEPFLPKPMGSVAFIHASPGSPGIDALVDNRIVTQSRISYLQSSIASPGVPDIYVPVETGNRNIRLSPDSGRNSVFTSNLAIETGKIYSVFAYDTLTSGSIRGLILNDDLTLPATGRTHVRFLHLAPNAPAVDVTLVRTSVTPNDSVTVATNRTYVGPSPNTSTLSPFVSIPGGTYTVSVKLAGSPTRVLAVPNINLSNGRIVSLYAAGTARSQPLAAGLVRHF
jgi:hypothetical protein